MTQFNLVTPPNHEANPTVPPGATYHDASGARFSLNIVAAAPDRYIAPVPAEQPRTTNVALFTARITLRAASALVRDSPTQSERNRRRL